MHSPHIDQFRSLLSDALERVSPHTTFIHVECSEICAPNEHGCACYDVKFGFVIPTGKVYNFITSIFEAYAAENKNGRLIPSRAWIVRSHGPDNPKPRWSYPMFDPTEAICETVTEVVRILIACQLAVVANTSPLAEGDISATGIERCNEAISNAKRMGQTPDTIHDPRYPSGADSQPFNPDGASASYRGMRGPWDLN